MDKIIQKNAYGVLGLKASATQSEIRKRSKKIIRYLSMERELDFDLDFRIYNEVRSEELIRKAVERLSHPEKKVVDSFFWFNEAEPIDEGAINSLKDEDYKGAINLWEEKMQEASSPYPLSKKNLAFLYCLLLFQEKDKDYLEKSLSLWEEIINSDEFWKAYIRFYQLYDEIDTNEEIISNFRENIESYLSNLYTELYNFHKGEDIFITKQFDFLSTKGDKLKKEILTPIYKDIISEVEKIESMKISEDGVFDKNEESELENSIDNIESSLEKLNELNLHKETRTQEVQDRAAKAIKTAVLDIHNNLRETGKAISLIKEALEIAGTSYMKKQIKNDIQVLENMNIAKPIEIEFPASFFAKGTIKFSKTFVERGNRKINYKDVTGVSYHSTRHYVNGVETGTSFNLSVEGEEKSIVVSFKSKSSKKEMRRKFSKLIRLVNKLITPQLTTRIIKDIKETGEVQIGPLFLRPEEVERKRLFFSNKVFSWKEVGKTKIFRGEVKIHNNKGKEIYSVSMKKTNAVLLPVLIPLLKKGEAKR